MSSSTNAGSSEFRPFYGLSGVFVVDEAVEVPSNWSLVPQGLSVGDSFRLLFIGTTSRNASSSDIADYNTFVQNLVATNGHAAIQAHSATFRMLGSTEDVDARDNTGTTGTGVPIYWLGGAKLADDYADFYDGSWDEEAAGRSETGALLAIGANLKIWTGSAQDGTEAMNIGGTESRALGNSGNHWVMQGSPNGSNSAHGPIESDTVNRTTNRAVYGLSGVFRVAGTAVTSDDATLNALSLSGITLSPSFAADTLTYTASVGNDVTSTTVTATANDDGATVAIVPADADDTADGHQVTLGVGDTAVAVTVTAEDETTTQTYAVTVTRAEAAVEVKSITMRRYDGRDGEPYRIGDELVFVVEFSHTVICTSTPTVRVRFYIGTSRKEAIRYILSADPKLWYRYIVQEGDLDVDGITIPAGPEALPEKYTKDSCTGPAFDETRIAAQGPLADRKVDGVRPMPQSAMTSLDGNSIIIGFSESLSATTAAASAFAVSVDPGTAPAVTGASASGDTVTLDLASALTSDQVVAVAYVDATSGNDAAAIQDAAGNDADTFTTGEGDVPAVSNAVGIPCPGVAGCYVVSADWGLIPSGLAAGDRFRLLFRTSGRRDATSSSIADYDAFVQNAAAGGHADIQQYRSTFRVLGSTADVDARDNTATTYTADDKGVAIHWLNGNKVADNYEDFYDGSWSNADAGKDEDGAAHTNPQVQTDVGTWTGSEANGTEASELFSNSRFGRGLGATFVGVGRPFGSDNFTAPEALGPYYGLSGVFVVAGTTVTSDDATLSALSLSGITLSPSFAADTLTYTGSVGSDVTSTTVTATANDDGATVAIVPADADDTADGHQVALGVGDTAITVTVTAEDGTTTQTYAVTVTRAEAEESAETTVPANWSLVPQGLGVGDRFRLIFISSTTRNGSSSDIADYNTFVQTAAANGHADIQSHSSTFRVVGSTADVDARDNTATTYTADDKGVAIYWLGGNKVADEYEDFYDGDWDDEANAKDESGNDRYMTFVPSLFPITGSDHDGTEAFTGLNSRALGSATFIRIGQPNSSTTGHGPLNSGLTATRNSSQPLYGLSGVFVVAGTAVTSDDATLSALSLSGITLLPSFAADTLTYTGSVDNDVTSTTVTATANDDGATVAILPADADDTADGHQVALGVGDTAVSVTVTAEDGTTTQTYAVTVTRAEAAVEVKSITMRRYDGRDGEPYRIGDELVFVVEFSHYMGCESQGEGRVRFYIGTSRKEASRYIVETHKHWHRYIVQEGDLDTDGITIPAGPEALPLKYLKDSCGGSEFDETGIAAQGPLADRKVDGVRPTPEFAATSVDGNSVIIVFSESLSATTAPASAFTLRVDTGTAPAVSTATASGNSVTLGLGSALTSDQVVTVTYVDPTSGAAAAAVQDAAGNDAANFTTGEGDAPAVSNAVGTGCSVVAGCYLVSADWGLIPDGLAVGAEFRLLFISSGTRDGASSNIGDYNGFVQTAAAGGHADIQQYSSTFRVVGSTADVDARDNTNTTYTSADKGVAIYWLGGNKVADEYEDFYDGGWDDESNAKDESGSNSSISGIDNFPITGSGHDGTEKFAGNDSRALGADAVTYGVLTSPNFTTGPLSSDNNFSNTVSKRLYGLSGVFVVSAHAVTSDDATLSALSLSGVTLSPSFAADTLTYTGSVDNDVTSTTVTATANDDGATVAIVPADADDTADGHQVTLGVGDTAVSVTVTAEDGTTVQTYAVTVTRAEAINNPPVFTYRGSFSNSFEENRDPNERVLSNVTAEAMDPDGVGRPHDGERRRDGHAEQHGDGGRWRRDLWLVWRRHIQQHIHLQPGLDRRGRRIQRPDFYIDSLRRRRCHD